MSFGATPAVRSGALILRPLGFASSFLLLPPSLPSCLDIQPILLFFPSSSCPTSDRGWLACMGVRHGENAGAHGWGHIEGCARGCFIERTGVILLLSPPLSSPACLPTFAYPLILSLVISTADGRRGGTSWKRIKCAMDSTSACVKGVSSRGQARGCFLELSRRMSSPAHWSVAVGMSVRDVQAHIGRRMRAAFLITLVLCTTLGSVDSA
ncbi:hypothetical protein C8J57DRAFT_1528446 [Mycena rebaudengoi]|nr:hypothetical protein C8J57DRAFT_1528446 [Mycena rebaudengoi]